MLAVQMVERCLLGECEEGMRGGRDLRVCRGGRVEGAWRAREDDVEEGAWRERGGRVEGAWRAREDDVEEGAWREHGGRVEGA